MLVNLGTLVGTARFNDLGSEEAIRDNINSECLDFLSIHDNTLRDFLRAKKARGRIQKGKLVTSFWVYTVNLCHFNAWDWDFPDFYDENNLRYKTQSLTFQKFFDHIFPKELFNHDYKDMFTQVMIGTYTGKQSSKIVHGFTKPAYGKLYELQRHIALLDGWIFSIPHENVTEGYKCSHQRFPCRLREV